MRRDEVNNREGQGGSTENKACKYCQPGSHVTVALRRSKLCGGLYVMSVLFGLVENLYALADC